MNLTSADFCVLRDQIIRDTFGGPATYALLKKRNPQIDMLLNAGIRAGAEFAESLRDRTAEAWPAYDVSEA